MNTLTGIGKEDRKRLSELFRETKGTISVTETARLLKITSTDAAKMLSRVRRGLYVRMALESRTADIPLEDPWTMADRLFLVCNIGVWSAAEYWDLTERIFLTLVVLTTPKPQSRLQLI